MIKILCNAWLLFIITSCAAQRSVTATSPLNQFLSDTNLRTAHVGVAVYDVTAHKFIYNYNGDKYFVPASNVKIASCYAAMKSLPAVLPGIKYFENDTALYIVPTGDPTFLHRDFAVQPVFNFLKSARKKIYLTTGSWNEKELGQGWSWDDYNDEYMTERNVFPVYGNTIRWVQEKIRSNSTGTEESFSIYSDPEVNWKVKFEADSGSGKFKVTRDRLSNMFVVSQGSEPFAEAIVPFITNGVSSSLELLADTLGKSISITNDFFLNNLQQGVVSSQLLDSVLRPMMYRSDNFFAEQLLLMSAGQKAVLMNDATIIDSITRNLKNKVVWVDGSGLSRYNLFSPNAFVEILDSMRTQFGMDRIKAIFPSGDSGTLKGYYAKENGKIFAKTGSMSGVIALSGFLYTKNNRLLVFSVLVNNHNGMNSNVRRAIERFIRRLMQ